MARRSPKRSSIQHYLIVDPDQPLFIHNARGQGADILTRIIRDDLATLSLQGLEAALAEIN